MNLDISLLANKKQNVAHNNRPYVILIIGLSHSGSTILERALASHPEAVGLGEIFHTIRPYTREGWNNRLQRSCSCGVPGWECPIWKRLSYQSSNLSFQERLADLIEHTYNTTGAKVLIDSSKRRDQARLYACLQRQGLVNVYPLILVRDYRGWATTSAHKRRGLTGNKDYLILAWKWLHKHLLIPSKLRWQGFSAPIILFDRFTQEPQSTVKQIYSSLNVKYNSFFETSYPLDLENSCQHALTGNAIRSDPARNRIIHQDDSWRQDPRVKRFKWLTWGPELFQRWLWKRQSI